MELDQTILITQARTGSSRLPNKVLLKIQEKELLKIQLDRLSKCTEINNLVVATTISPEDQIIMDLCANWNVQCHRGSVDDVLDRFYSVVKETPPKWVVRVTSDCPLLDPELVDAVIKLAKVNNVDYASNILEEHFPDGQDVEVFKFSALERAWKEATLKSDREHVTLYIRRNSNHRGGNIFTSVNFPCFTDFSDIRMTVDEEADFNLINKLIQDIGDNQTWLRYTSHIIDNKLQKLNNGIIRNEGLIKSLKND